MKTICPGCNFGCGLYLQPKDADAIALNYRDGLLELDFKKGSEVNEGKLCRFGMELPHYYASKIESSVDGSVVEIEQAVEEAATRLKNAGDAVVFTFGDATCEEVLALDALASALNAPLESGYGVLSKVDGDCIGTITTGVPYSAVEEAKNIILLGVDPYAQYSLILRRILKAKKNGAKVTYVGWRAPRNLADEVILLSPGNVVSTFRELEGKLTDTEDALVISDITPHTEPAQLKAALKLGKAGVLLLKPFANTSGLMITLGGERAHSQRSLSELLEAIDNGEIKTLVTFEADIIQAMPDAEAVKETLEKLDLLVVIASRKSPICDVANVVISPEQTWEKMGTLVNNEGRALELGGEAVGAYDAIMQIATALGADNMGFEDAHSRVMEMLGIEKVDEYSIPTYQRGECSVSEIEGEDEPITLGLVKVYTPFSWHDLEYDYICVSEKLAREKGFVRDNVITLKTARGEGKYPFRLDPVADDVVLTFGRLNVSSQNITPLDEVENTVWIEETEISGKEEAKE